MSVWIVLSCTAIVEWFVLRRLRFDWFVVATVLAGTVLCVDYLTYTSISERNYDGPSQIVYIQSIAQHLRLPDVYACGPCGHPPLYYALAALWSKLVLVGGWMPLELGLKWLSLLLFVGFIVFSLLIVRSCVERQTTLRLAAALIVFWPSSIINSVRVHNDSLASLLMLAAMYFIAQWDRQGRARSFYAALAGLGACAADQVVGLYRGCGAGIFRGVAPSLAGDALGEPQVLGNGNPGPRGRGSSGRGVPRVQGTYDALPEGPRPRLRRTLRTFHPRHTESLP